MEKRVLCAAGAIQVSNHELYSSPHSNEQRKALRSEDLDVIAVQSSTTVPLLDVQLPLTTQQVGGQERRRSHKNVASGHPSLRDKKAPLPNLHQLHPTGQAVTV